MSTTRPWIGSHKETGGPGEIQSRKKQKMKDTQDIRCSQEGSKKLNVLEGTDVSEGQVLWQPGGAEEDSCLREGNRHLHLAYNKEEEC